MIRTITLHLTAALDRTVPSSSKSILSLASLMWSRIEKITREDIKNTDKAFMMLGNLCFCAVVEEYRVSSDTFLVLLRNKAPGLMRKLSASKDDKFKEKAMEIFPHSYTKFLNRDFDAQKMHSAFRDFADLCSQHLDDDESKKGIKAIREDIKLDVLKEAIERADSLEKYIVLFAQPQIMVAITDIYQYDTLQALIHLTASHYANSDTQVSYRSLLALQSPGSKLLRPNENDIFVIVALGMDLDCDAKMRSKAISEAFEVSNQVLP